MTLTIENIQAAVRQADRHLEANGVGGEQRARFRLLLEDVLISYRERAEGAPFRLICIRRWKTVSVTVRVAGESMNPFERPGALTEGLLSGLESLPTWSYGKGGNVITYTPVSAITGMNYLRFAMQYVWQEKRAFTWACVLRFLNMGLVVLEPLLSARIIVAYSAPDIHRIILAAALILCRSVLSSAVNYYASKTLRLSYSAMTRRMQHDMIDHILRIRTDCVDRSNAGVFSQRLITETVSFVESIDEALGISTEAFRLVSLVIAYAMVSPPMLLLELVLFAVYLVIQRNYSRSLQENGRKCRIADEKRAGFVGEMIRAHRDIKLLHCEDSFQDKLCGSIDESNELLTAMRIKSMRFILLRSQFVGWMGFAYMTLLALMIARHGMSPATALVLYNYNQSAYGSLRSVSGLINTLYALGLSAERIYSLMKSPDFREDQYGTVHLDGVRGELELRNVHFAYKHPEGGSTKVLRGINLYIRAGESVAFVGASGCGKSTILSLLSRLFDPDRGEVLLDGVDLRKLDQDTVHGSITMVSQSPYIFNMSVRGNLSAVKKDLTEEEMERACRTACIHEDIVNFINGYDTVVGESGVMMSGGQRQRLALARSLLCDAPVILLDEATSALDGVTQSEISRAIENLRGRRTTVTVAHRLSTVIRCDRLFFIQDGRVLASGTHRELLETCEEYRRLYSEETGAA